MSISNNNFLLGEKEIFIIDTSHYWTAGNYHLRCIKAKKSEKMKSIIGYNNDHFENLSIFYVELLDLEAERIFYMSYEAGPDWGKLEKFIYFLEL